MTVREWVVDRFALQPVYDRLLDRRVPKASWYTGDGATLLALLGVQVLTGAVLVLTYSPAADSAYESVVDITERQTFGWFVRGMHYWSGGLMVVVLFYHLFRQIVTGGYKAPREGTWIIGVLLFVCVLLMSYTGYLLRWDERAVHGVRVMLHMLVRVPLMGESLTLLVQGGPDIGPRTLTRLYAVHVLLIPLAMFALAGMHLYLVIQRGTMTRAEREQAVDSAEEQQRLYKEEAESSRGETFFPYTTFKTGIMAGAVLTAAVLFTLIRGPAELFPEANLTDPSMPAEEWWFWWYSGLIALLPPVIAPWFVVVFPVLIFFGLLALPFLDRGPRRGIRQRPVWGVVVIVVIIAMLMLSDYRRRSPFTGWPDPNPPEIPVEVELTPEAERGRILFARYGCNSCHPIAGKGPRVGTDFAKMRSPMSVQEIREYTLQPPAGVAMPAYEGRLRGEELDAVVEFCHVAQTFPRRL
jgi:ubiquinol-cytochrome c reductase cytochrome b subunit